MIDREWLRENAEGCIESIKQRPVISAEQQGLLNVLNATLLLINEVEHLLSEKYDEKT